MSGSGPISPLTRMYREQREIDAEKEKKRQAALLPSDVMTGKSQWTQPNVFNQQPYSKPSVTPQPKSDGITPTIFNQQPYTQPSGTGGGSGGGSKYTGSNYETLANARNEIRPQVQGDNNRTPSRSEKISRAYIETSQRMQYSDLKGLSPAFEASEPFVQHPVNTALAVGGGVAFGAGLAAVNALLPPVGIAADVYFGGTFIKGAVQSGDLAKFTVQNAPVIIGAGIGGGLVSRPKVITKLEPLKVKIKDTKILQGYNKNDVITSANVLKPKGSVKLEPTEGSRPFIEQALGITEKKTYTTSDLMIPLEFKPPFKPVEQVLPKEAYTKTFYKKVADTNSFVNEVKKKSNLVYYDEKAGIAKFSNPEKNQALIVRQSSYLNKAYRKQQRKVILNRLKANDYKENYKITLTPETVYKTETKKPTKSMIFKREEPKYTEVKTDSGTLLLEKPKLKETRIYEPKQKFKQGLKQEFKELQITGEKIKTKTFTFFKSKFKVGQSAISRTKSIITQMPKIDIGQVIKPEQIIVPKVITNTIIDTRTEQIIKPIIFTSILTKEIIQPPKKFKSNISYGGGSGSFFGRGFKTSVQRGFKYAPSLGAIAFNIKSKKVPKNLTGLEMRPIKI